MSSISASQLQCLGFESKCKVLWSLSVGFIWVLQYPLISLSEGGFYTMNIVRCVNGGVNVFTFTSLEDAFVQIGFN